MAQQVWVQCLMTDTQTVKKCLGDNLDRTQKIRLSDEEGFLEIPTTFDTMASIKPILPKGLKFTLEKKVPLKIFQAPIELAVSNWLHSLPDKFFTQSPSFTVEELLEVVPKGWTVYHPMVMLPSGSFQDAKWKIFMSKIKMDSRSHWYELWEAILESIQKLEGQQESKRLTHLAVNAGIPLVQKVNQSLTNNNGNDKSTEASFKKDLITRQNFLRSPSGLIMLYGNFGPSICDPEEEHQPIPTKQDFDNAFWVSTNQNGIYQTWAPKYTMFSRGNIKEKARILNFHNRDESGTLKPEVDTRRYAIDSSELQKSVAVDMYAGIGYFVFSYAKMGIGRVFCWEINAWSIEGLRRGAEKNGWGITVLNEEDLRDLNRGRKSLDDISPTAKIVVFPESNKYAYDRLCSKSSNPKPTGNIIHVNCGLLPTSQSCWRNARDILVKDGSPGWLHIHENVALEDIESKREMIQGYFEENHFSRYEFNEIEVEHTELVKTFAPGVWHCVYDVWFEASMDV